MSTTYPTKKPFDSCEATSSRPPLRWLAPVVISLGFITLSGCGAPTMEPGEEIDEEIEESQAALSGDAASIGWTQVPGFVMPGQISRIKITATNTGSNPWSGSGSSNWYRLGAGGSNAFRFSYFPSCGGFSNSLTDARVYTCTSVSPGGANVYNVDARAPSAGTSAVVSAQLVHDGVAWFGNKVSKTVGVGQQYCGTAVSQCILSYRPDILAFYASNGWDTSCWNRDAIVQNWCSIDPAGCASLKSGSCASFNNATRCTNGKLSDGTPIDPKGTFDGFQVCGMDHQMYKCLSASAPNWTPQGTPCQ